MSHPWFDLGQVLQSCQFYKGADGGANDGFFQNK